MKVTVFDPRNCSSHALFLSNVLIYLLRAKEHLRPLIVVCAMYLTDISISGVLLFQRSAYSDRFWVYCQYFRRPLSVFISDTVFFFETIICIHLFFQRKCLTWHTICSYSLLERPLFYYKIAVVAIHSFKFIVFLWNRISSKEVS